MVYLSAITGETQFERCHVEYRETSQGNCFEIPHYVRNDSVLLCENIVEHCHVERSETSQGVSIVFFEIPHYVRNDRVEQC